MLASAKKKLVIATLSLGAVLFGGSRNTAWGLIPVLSSGNSTIAFDPATSTSSWTVDGINEFGGTPAGGDLLEYFNGSVYAPLAGLTVVSHNLSGNIGSATFSGTLDSDNFTIAIKAILTGGAAGSGTSALSETITVNNLGPTPVPSDVSPAIAPAPIDFLIQDNVDANLNATPNDDTLTLSPSTPNTAVQTDPIGVKLVYTTTPTPTTYALIDGGSPSLSLGPKTGNEAFFFNWDLSLAPGDSGIISITENITGQKTVTTGVPLPKSAYSSLTMLAALGAFGIIRRSRRAAV